MMVVSFVTVVSVSYILSLAVCAVKVRPNESEYPNSGLIERLERSIWIDVSTLTLSVFIGVGLALKVAAIISPELLSP